LAEETMYAMLDVPVDILGPDSPPGRGVLDGTDIQVAVLGGSPASTDQARRIAALAKRLVGTGRIAAPGVAALPQTIDLSALPGSVDGLPVLGISDEDLEAIGFSGEGAFLLGGPPASGRSNALTVLSRAVRQARPDARMHFVTSRRTPLAAEPLWTTVSNGPEEAATWARDLVAAMAGGDGPSHVIVIEALTDFLQTPADGPLVEVLKAAKRSGAWVIAENETSGWSASWPLIAEVRNGKKGVLLQPDALEGDLIFKAAFPRVPRTEFPAGRGYFVRGGRVVRVQLPLAD
jgi:S-DNA-T family DNA segregation ATPase FtsK/SpoIIIE